MLEQIARAIAEAHGSHWESEITESDKKVCRVAARAVLAVMREPSPEMVAAIWSKIDDGKEAAGIRRLGPGPGGRDVIAAYCDAILAEAGRD